MVIVITGVSFIKTSNLGGLGIRGKKGGPLGERIKEDFINLHIQYIMRNSNNKRTEEQQQLRTVAKQTYAITHRPQYCLYQSKMQTIRRNQSKQRVSTRTNDQSTVLERKSTSKKSINITQNLKQQFDHFVHELFTKIDFDCSGFITATKISYYKHLPEEVFYFFGGIFQKIKQLGGVTEKLFMSLCDEAFVHTKADDIEELLKPKCKDAKEVRDSNQAFLKKTANVRDKLHSLSCGMLKNSKMVRKTEVCEKQTNEPLYERKGSYNTISKKESLKKQLDCFAKRQCFSTGKNLKTLACEEIPTQRIKENSNFSSLRIKQLSQRLDRQIAHSQIRINIGKSLR